MTKSKKIFVDSSVFYAFINRAHPKYPEAMAFFRYFAQESYQVFTSYPEIEQAYRQIYYKISPSLAKDFMRGLMLGSINILYPDERDLKSALKVLINYRNNELTFEDAQSAVLANKNIISSICTFNYLHPLFGLSVFNLPV